MRIEVKKPSKKKLEELAVGGWPIWEKEESTFDWFYDDKETCYFLEGDVEIEFPDKTTTKITAGDLAIFPKGLSCKWHIKKKVKKHYKFG